MRSRKPHNPAFLKVWELLEAKGELKGLDGEDAIRKVVDTYSKVVEEIKTSEINRKLYVCRTFKDLLTFKGVEK